MTPRERVLTAFARQDPDRVPINYAGNPDINRRLIEHFGLQQGDYEGLLVALGVDFRSVHAPYIGPTLHEKVPGRHVDIWGIRRRYIEHPSGGYWDYCDFPLREATEEEVAKWPLPSPDDFDVSGIAEACKNYEAYAINGAAGYGDIINGNGMLRGMEQTLVDLVTDNPAGLLLADRRMKIQLAVTERIIEAADGRIDFLWLGEDLGTQLGPIISPAVFRKHIRPRYERFCDLARAYNLYVMMHCCGSSSWAFADFIEMGIHVVDTLQPEAKDMAPSYLKATYGDRLAFHGCISTAGPLAYGTVEEVRATVRETLEVMMPGGGYCLAPSHMIQDNTPTENVLAMYEAAKEYGRY
ncbi:MAG: uroporphyrinogen decarboxylase family protein [Candidatus Zipacnadales bacterium]